MVHTPVHASWTNQIEILFSIVQRKVVQPNDLPGPDPGPGPAPSVRRPPQRHGTAVPVEVHHLHPGRSAGQARPTHLPTDKKNPPSRWERDQPPKDLRSRPLRTRFARGETDQPLLLVAASAVGDCTECRRVLAPVSSAAVPLEPRLLADVIGHHHRVVSGREAPRLSPSHAQRQPKTFSRTQRAQGLVEAYRQLTSANDRYAAHTGRATSPPPQLPLVLPAGGFRPVVTERASWPVWPTSALRHGRHACTVPAAEGAERCRRWLCGWPTGQPESSGGEEEPGHVGEEAVPVHGAADARHEGLAVRADLGPAGQ